MTYAYHWRKAMVLSICLHIFLVITAGYLMAGLAAPLPKPEEVMLEMDLVSDPTDRMERIAAPPESVQPPDNPKIASTEMPLVIPTQTETFAKESEPVVTTSELSMTKTEISSSAPSPNQSANPGSPANPATTGAAGSPATSNGSRSSIAAPGILAKVDPIYPPAAKQAGLEGTVTLRIQILANGRPDEITITRSTGYSVLDDAAVAAVRKWLFIPAKDRNSGRAVTCTTTLPVSFRLHDLKR